MSESPAPNDPHSLSSRLARLNGGDPVKTLPKHVRWAAAYGYFAAIAIGGINISSLRSDGTLFPKTVILVPTLLLLSTWMLIDARALADGRRPFDPGLWTCIVVGSAVGLGIIKALTGSWF